jgi:hypothetical protein
MSRWLALIASLAAGCGQMGLSQFNLPDGAAALEICFPEGEIFGCGEACSGSDLNFGAVDLTVGPISEQVMLESTGESQVAVIDVYFAEFTSNAFSLGNLPLPITLDQCNGIDAEPDVQVPWGFPVVVEFTPDAIGQFSGKLLVEQDVGDGEIEVHTVAIVGEGCNPNTGGC